MSLVSLKAMVCLGCIVLIVNVFSSAKCLADVSFRNDVMAVISKAGCNAGACHGNKNGKAGFKLSLRGQDPDTDYDTLTRDLFARRIDPLNPDRSLILLKPTTQISHEGGLRFRIGSPEYEIIRQWITEGRPRDPASTPVLQKLVVTPGREVLVEPADRAQIKATAIFSDGSRRDVSSLAVYEQSAELTKISPDGLVVRQRDGETTVIVRYLQCQQVVRLAFVPARPDFKWKPLQANNYIDQQVFAKLRELRMNASEPCSDAMYVRRAYLDLLGILPTPDEAKSFIDDHSADKRAKLVDALIKRPEYADFWSLKWSDLLRSEERTLDRKGVQAFHHWIRKSMAENKPLDEFAREMISGRGSTYENPPANYYRANRDAVTRGQATAQVFLGLSLRCAQCHNHPFDRWTQDDFYGWADLFSRVDYKVIENNRRDINDSHEFIGEQIVYEKNSGDVEDPRPGHVPTPRLLGAGAISRRQDRLEAVANWVTSPSNPYFAKAQVNRIWYHLMGPGLVDPVDDFRATNPATHPELLDQLADDFVKHGYDAQYIIKLIMASQTYALSSEPNATNADDEVNYSHVIPRRLTAEQLLDCEHEVAQVPEEFAGYPAGMRAEQIPGVRVVQQRRGGRPSMADQFLVTFGKPPRLLTCECERSNDTTLGQTFQLITGPEVSDLLEAKDNRIGRLISDGKNDSQIINEMYWAALTRAPSARELSAMADHVKKARDRRGGLEDVGWALLNAKEFILRQ